MHKSMCVFAFLNFSCGGIKSMYVLIHIYTCMYVFHVTYVRNNISTKFKLPSAI